MSLHFAVAGAQRCGTTSLCYLLDAHPDLRVLRPLRPEPKIFLNHLDPIAYLETVVRRQQGEVDELLGEKATSYLEHGYVARRMRQCCPGIHVVFVLRHPVERAISNYYFSKSHGLESLSLEQAIHGEQERVDSMHFPNISVHPFAYVRRGRYIDDLEPYLQEFPPEQIAVVLFERLRDAPLTTCQALYRFLGVNDKLVPHGLHSVYNRTDMAMEPVSDSMINYLMDAYAEPNRKLEERLRIDLSEWNRPSRMLMELMK